MKLSLLATSVLLAAVSASAYAYTPGTYTAAIAGQNGPVKVEVTTSADKILSVKIIDQKETEGIGSKAVAALPSEIVKAQSADVQGIAGASVSSAAIKKAVQECLNQAQGKKAAPLALKNGTFEGKAYGNNGWLTVEVNIKDNKITDIKTPGQRETKYLGDTAIREIGKDVLQYQTLNVDNIAGATVTSTALKTAIAQAIEKAGGDIAAFQKPVPEKIKKVAGITKGSADLIIVGAGGAGLSAAVTAKDLGVKNVLVLEKMPVIGGNTLRCASAFNAADPDRQKALPMTETLKEAVVKAINEKPVSEEIAILIERSIQYTKKKWGETEYIFVSDSDPSLPAQYNRIQTQVVQMIREKDLRDDYGRLFGFGTHMYRHYYGVKLTEMHLDDWTIARLLGHSSVHNVKYYRKMSNQILADETRKVRERLSQLILENLDGWGEEYEQVRYDVSCK